MPRCLASPLGGSIRITPTGGGRADRPLCFGLSTHAPESGAAWRSSSSRGDGRRRNGGALRRGRSPWLVFRGRPAPQHPPASLWLHAPCGRAWQRFDANSARPARAYPPHSLASFSPLLSGAGAGILGVQEILGGTLDSPSFVRDPSSGCGSVVLTSTAAGRISVGRPSGCARGSSCCCSALRPRRRSLNAPFAFSLLVVRVTMVVAGASAAYSRRYAGSRHGPSGSTQLAIAESSPVPRASAAHP